MPPAAWPVSDCLRCLRCFPSARFARPPAAAPRVASVPYDVVNTEEARGLAEGNPLSFLRVTRVGDRSARRPQSLRRAASTPGQSTNLRALRRADAARSSKTRRRSIVIGCGWVPTSRRAWPAASRLTNTTAVCVKKHEKTRKDKEDDRTRHITELRAQTGLVFLDVQERGPTAATRWPRHDGANRRMTSPRPTAWCTRCGGGWRRPATRWCGVCRARRALYR